MTENFEYRRDKLAVYITNALDRCIMRGLDAKLLIKLRMAYTEIRDLYAELDNLDELVPPIVTLLGEYLRIVKHLQPALVPIDLPLTQLEQDAGTIVEADIDA